MTRRGTIGFVHGFAGGTSPQAKSLKLEIVLVYEACYASKFEGIGGGHIYLTLS